VGSLIAAGQQRFSSADSVEKMPRSSGPIAHPYARIPPDAGKGTVSHSVDPSPNIRAPTNPRWPHVVVGPRRCAQSVETSPLAGEFHRGRMCD